jgi:6-phosphogluconolactonase (cycloisomerase 2 family)
LPVLPPQLVIIFILPHVEQVELPTCPPQVVTLPLFVHNIYVNVLHAVQYVPCLKSDWVRMFKFNADTGKLTPNSYPAAAAAAAGASQPAAGSDARSSSVSSSSGGDNRVRLVPGSGPRHLAFHPALPVAYVLNELSSTIARFDWDGSSSSSGSGSGLLTADFEQEPDRIVSMLPPGISADPVCVKLGDTSCAELHRPYGGAELALSNDGRFLYASNRGLCQGTPAAGKSSIVTFAVDDATGALTPLDWQCGAGDVQHPRHISLTPDEANAFVLVANMNSGSVTVFRRDSSSGLLTKVATVLTAGGGVQQPAFVAVL